MTLLTVPIAEMLREEIKHQPKAIRNAEAGEDADQVSADGVLAQASDGGDFLVHFALKNQGDDLNLARRKGVAADSLAAFSVGERSRN